MKRKTKIILTLAGIALGCIGLAACATETELDILEKEGCTVSVTYDANGGKIGGQSGISVVNMFNPDNFKDSDGDGKVEISLKSTDPVLFKENDLGAPEKNGYFFAGWFQTRELVTVNGKPVDDYGRPLEKRDNVLYVEGTKEIATQAYSYADMWDFENDKVLYQPGSGKYELTLYAAWVPYYQFNYYYQPDDSTEWKLLNSTTFDYSTTQTFKDTYVYDKAAKDTVDSDTIWVPKWSGKNDTGAMVHTHSYSDKTTYTFPSFQAHTFVSAYTDEKCQNLIADSLQHHGTLIYNKESKKLEVNNLTQDVYIKFQIGEQYRITTADEFVTYAERANAYSVYTIMSSELDFEGKKWPASLSGGEFAGKILGNNSTFKNISAANSNSGATYGGLFGWLTESAEIENITITDAVYDMATGTTKDNSYFGLFAGGMEQGAMVTGVTVKNSVLKMGKLARSSYHINLICGSGINNISYSGISVVLTGTERKNGDVTEYQYFVTDINVNGQTGEVTPSIEISTQKAVIRGEASYIAYPATENN